MRIPVDQRTFHGQAALATWVERMARHDESALAALYDSVSRDIYRIALKLVGRSAAAEEVVGDCFWQVWQQAERYSRDRGSVMAWMASIARSRAIDLVRRRQTVEKHETPIDATDVFETEDAESDDVFALMNRRLQEPSDERDLDATRIGGLLDELAPAQRQMVSLAFYAGLSHQEIAEHCHLPLGTVKSHLRRGLAALKELCEEVGLTVDADQ